MRNEIEKIRDSKPSRAFIVATGAGAGIQDNLWRVPGVSKFLIGCALPYAPEATTDFLGFKPERFVSDETSMDLAMEAYRRAYVPGGAPAVGVGLTASVASMEAHRGDHRVIAAYFTAEGAGVTRVILPKGEGRIARSQDGVAADNIGLRALFAAYNLRPEPAFEVADKLARERIFAHPLFLADRNRSVILGKLYNGFTLYPGAFNPPHFGHFGAANTVRGAGQHVIYTTCVNPPHKGTLTTAEILQRASMMKGHDFLVTENDPLYLDKARAFPGARFVIGADAAVRLLDPCWGAPIEPMLKEFEELQTRFYLFDRMTAEGRITFEHVLKKLPNGLYDHLFIPQPGLWDISSTEIRTGTKGNAPPAPETYTKDSDLGHDTLIGGSG